MSEPEDASDQQTATLRFDLTANEPQAMYTDASSVQVGYYGIQLTFGVVREIKGNKLIRPMATVGMSPEHASILNEVLGRSLETYVRKFGPIRPKVDQVEHEPAPTEPGEGDTA